jgi:predicted amidohydrolase YtcJ
MISVSGAKSRPIARYTFRGTQAACGCCAAPDEFLDRVEQAAAALSPGRAWTEVVPLTQPYQWACSSQAMHEALFGRKSAPDSLILRALLNEAPGVLTAGKPNHSISRANPSPEADDSAVPPPELAIINGKIFTGDAGHPWCEALLIQNGRIAAAGSTQEIRLRANRFTKIIDVRGRLVIPGFNDAHMHHTPDPKGVRLPIQPYNEIDFGQVSELVQEAASGSAPGTWIFGAIGAQLINEPRLNRFELDRLAPLHPVIFLGRTNHTNVVNTEAMRRLGIAESEPDPLGGFFERLPGTSVLTGRINEYAQWTPQRCFASMTTIAEGVESLRALAKNCVEFGITTLQNMSWTPIARYAQMLEQAALPIKVRAIRFPPSGPEGRILSEGAGLARDIGPRASIDGVKWILDGTTVERAAALGRPYADDPTVQGRENFSAADVTEMLREAVASGRQLLLHAIGTKTLETVIRCLEDYVPAQDWAARCLRIEHGDGLNEDQIRRLKVLGVMVVQNPSHFLLKHIYGPRFGNDILFASFRSLHEAGIPLALGSDGPLNPFISLMAAVTHPARPGEAISMADALIAYTSGSAGAEGKQHSKGRLVPGQEADIAVLSQDIFTIETALLPETRSLITIIDGTIVHCADGSFLTS